MDISLRVAGSGPADQLAAFAARVEEAGFAGMGVPDSQLIMRDVYVNLALAAQSTSRLRLYTAVTNPITRHASVLASAAQTVEELAPGRVAIIIGSGYSAVQTIGRKAATMDQMREAVVTMKRLLAGERVVLEGFEAHLPFASGRQIPVLIGATGPRTIELAGEVADGALIAVGVHPVMMETARRRFEAGARKSGRDPASMEVIYVSRVHLEQDMEAALAMARPICAEWILEAPRARWLREAGIEVPDFEIPEEVSRLYPDIVHAEDWDEAVRATAFLPRRLVEQVSEALGLFCTPEQCVRRLGELEEWGVRRLFLQTIETYNLPEATLHAFRDQVFPRLRG